MPRSPRTVAESGIYHVTLRGNAKADIFETEEHREHFLELLARYRDECHFSIIAWCLMDNHVHLVVYAGDSDLSSALQRLATAYAVYFNNAENRVGHLFQSPFRSKPIEYEEQLINTVRYVHQNPERAHICATADYRWSSYAEYADRPVLVDTSIALGVAGSVDGLLETSPDLDYVVRETPMRLSLSDEAARNLIVRRLGIPSCGDVVHMAKRDRNRIVLEAARLRISPAQLARIFGMGERTVYRIVRNAFTARESNMTPLKGVVSKGV